QDIDLSQFRDDLFGLVTLSRHEQDPPRCHKTYFKVDQFNGGGSAAHLLDQRSIGEFSASLRPFS
ncbi:MAG: hypothetical protein ACK5PF_07850, partial [bacterium]